MLDPKSILVRPDRQRKRGLGDLTGLRESIAQFGIIHPIILRQDEDGTVLVAGQRRLQCCIDLGRDIRVGEFRFWEDLTPAEAGAIELEENVKREDLHWRDSVAAYGGLHAYYSLRAKADGKPWSIESSANRLAIHKSHLGDILVVWRNIDSPIISDADSLTQAFSRLQREAERRAVGIVNELASVGAEAFGGKEDESDPDFYLGTAHAGDHPARVLDPIPLPHGYGNSAGGGIFTGPSHPSPSSDGGTGPAPTSPRARPQPVLVADFNTWAATYSGPKFTFIHCDFPYGVNYTNYGNSIQQTGEDLYTTDAADYWRLVDSLCIHLDKFCSYSAHVMFWFSMTHHAETRKRLESAGLYVHDHPLIWHKTDNAGIIPGRDNQFLRRVYETAFICSRGKRPFVKLISNAYGAPTAPNQTHPSHKPEPVLRHFFQATIDSTTSMLDPTSGSGSALIAAEDRGAERVLGLEINPKFAEDSIAAVEIARTKRRLAGG